MLVASLLWWLALGELRGEVRAPAWLVALSWAALVLAFLAAGLGVMTSASYSGLACPDLPLCTPHEATGGWSPSDLNPWRTGAASASIHMAHRSIALLAAAVVLALAWGLARLDGAGRRLRNVLGVALAAQLLLGVSLVALALPLPIAVLHNLGATLLLLSLVAAHHLVVGPRGA